MVITAFNPDVSQLEKTFLAQSYNLGVTSVEVKNNQQFANNSRILIGEPGLAYSEIVTTGSPNANGTTMPIGATLYSHEADSPVYLLQFDQVQFLRSTTGINGTYSVLSTVNLDVTNENLQTSYNDLTSATGYFYKTAMYNSSSTVTSALSDAIPAGGWQRKQVGYLIDQIYTELTDVTEDNMPRSELIGYFNDVNDDLLLQNVRPFNFLYTRQVFGRTAGANSLDWPTDAYGNNIMWKFDHMDYNYVDNTTNPATNNTYTVEVVPLTFFRNRWISNENDATTQDDYVQEMTLNEATQAFDYYPASLTTSNAVWYLYYWAAFNEIVSEGDYFQTPTVSLYKYYAKYAYYMKRSVSEPEYATMAKENFNQYMRAVIRLKSQDRRDAGTPRRFENSGFTRRSFRR